MSQEMQLRRIIFDTCVIRITMDFSLRQPFIALCTNGWSSGAAFTWFAFIQERTDACPDCYWHSFTLLKQNIQRVFLFFSVILPLLAAEGPSHLKVVPICTLCLILIRNNVQSWPKISIQVEGGKKTAVQREYLQKSICVTVISKQINKYINKSSLVCGCFTWSLFCKLYRAKACRRVL